MSKLDTVNTAKERLLTKGWVQGAMSTPDGRVCLMGAFCFSTGDGIFETLETLRDIVGESVSRWNDAPERTFNDVIDVLDELALRVKEEV